MPDPESMSGSSTAPATRSNLAVLVAVINGGVIATQSKFNGELSAAGTGAIISAWFSYAGTLLAIVVVLLAIRRGRSTIHILRTRGRWWWYWIGICGVPMVIAMAFGIPIIGVAIASVCSVAGQTVSGLILDSRGVGVPKPIRLSAWRILAGLFALAGLLIAVLFGQSGVSGSALLVIFAGFAIFASGVVFCILQSGNGVITQRSGDPMIAALTSVIGGFVTITVISGIAGIFGGLNEVVLPDPTRFWWLYLGGPLGAVITVAAAWAVRHLGSFALTLSVVAGQMCVAVVLDLIAGQSLSWATLLAIAVIASATLLAIIPVRHPADSTH